MKNIRQLIKKGDPRLNVLMPKVLKEFILHSARQGRRSQQSELIRRLAATFKHEERCTALQDFLIDRIKIAYRSGQ